MEKHLQTEDAPVRGRIAPTPSGYLHLGNGVNFVLIWLMVRAAGGTIKLRIDDADATRTRSEFVEDIFRQLEWLGLDWDKGPEGPDDFHRSHSQLRRLARYREVLEELSAHTFACTCSRKEIAARSADGLYPGTCRDRRGRPQVPHAVRVRVEPECTIRVAGKEVALGRTMGDFVLWRKDDLPAYQLASLADDLDDRINLVVRGQDLLASTAAQLLLAERLGAAAFLTARFVHHPLLTDPSGRKLAKSDRALSLAAMRETGAAPVTVYREAGRLLGLDPAMIGSLTDLQTGWKRSQHRIFARSLPPV